MLVKNYKDLLKDKGILYGLLTGFILALAITSWVYVGDKVDTMSWVVVSFLIPAFISFSMAPKKVVNNLAPFTNKSIIATMLLLGVFYVVGSIASLYAYQYGTFSDVSPLRQTSIIVTVILALIFLKDERTDIVKKIIVAIMYTIGVVLMVV